MLQLYLLGGFNIVAGDGLPVILPTRKTALLLAILAASERANVSRDQLMNLLWSTRGEGQAHASLRQSLYALRRSLEPFDSNLLVVEREVIGLRQDRAEADVWQLRSALGSRDRERLAAAAELYRGPFLAGLIPPDPAFDEWLSSTRNYLRDQAMILLQQLVEASVASDSAAEAVRAAERLVEIDNLRESSHRLLMRTLAATGDRASAIQRFAECREVLARELGVAPSEETEQLYQSIKDSTTSAQAVGKHHSMATALEEAKTSPKPAVAVLPLTNLKGDARLDYFCAGLTEDVITALAAWRSFPVISRDSSFSYPSESNDPRGIGRELGAQYLLRGAVRKEGRRVRVSVRLIDAESGHHVWADYYDRLSADVFKVQDEIALSVAAILVPEIEQAEIRRIAAKRTDSLTAWQSCLRGRELLNSYSCKGNSGARVAFERALEVDVDYPDAWVGLAYCYLRDIDLRCSGDRQNALEEGFAAARRAVALDQASSAARLCLGQAYVWAENFDLAIAETEAAVDLNPSNAHARMALGNRLDLAGRSAEGIAQMERSLQLNPRDPNRFVYMGYLARAYIRLCRYETALSWATKMVALKADSPEAHFRLAVCLAHLDRPDEARRALDTCERLHPGFLKMRASWRPYSDPVANDLFFAGLRRHRLVA